MLKWLSFLPVLFFASQGFTAGGDGGGGADAGGGASVAEPAETVETGTEPTETGTEAQPAEGEQPEGQQPDAGASGPVDRVKVALDKLRATDPKMADSLRKVHFSNLDYQKSFATPSEARAAKETIELLGGEEGIANLQNEVREYSDVLSRMATGDPASLDVLLNDSRDGFIKLGRPYMEKLRQIDSQAFDKVMAPHLAESLMRTGAVGTMDNLLRYIRDGKQTEAFEEAQKLRGWADGVKSFAEQNKEEPVSEREKALQAKEQEINTEKTNLYRGQVGQSVVRVMNSTISKHLEPLMKGKNLTMDQKKDIAEGIYTEIARNLQGNKSFQSKLKAHLDKNSTPAEIARFHQSYLDDVTPNAVKALWARRGFAASPNGGAGRTTQQSSASPQTVNQKPAAETIDWAQDRNRMRFQRGEATLKKEFGGKVVRWSWDRV